MKTITLSADNIAGYHTKQEGYGRQGLYLLVAEEGIDPQTIYWGSVFPNVREHWGLHTTDEVFPKLGDERDHDGEPVEIEGEFVDCSGNDVRADRIFPTIIDGIIAMVSGDEVEVKESDDNE
jgi:hypothetical protein